MKLLIIGGTGNISRWILREVQYKDCDISVFNRHQTMQDLPSGVKQITGDRTNHDDFEKKIQNQGPFDCVIDMVGYETEDALSSLRAFEGKTEQYIFCSTVDVYSKNQSSYPVFDDQPFGASETFTYAFKKMQMEKIFWDAYEKFGFPLTVIRPGFTYSEGWSPLLTCFGGQSYHLDRLIRNKPVIIQDEGNMCWSPLHAEDLARAFVSAMGNKKAIGKSYNITGDELLNWKTMHEKTASILNAAGPDFIFIPTNDLAALAPERSQGCVDNFQFNCLFDNSKAKNELGFRFTVSFDAGASRCIDYLIATNGIEKESKYPFYDQVILKWESLNCGPQRKKLKSVS